MKTPLFRRNGITGTLASAALAALLLTAGRAQAAPYQFAQFTETTATPFSFTNNGGTSGNVAVTNAASLFNFTAQTGLSTTSQPVFLNISPVAPPSTFTPATTLGGSLDQSIGNLEKLVIASGLNGTGINYLTMFFTGDISGLVSGASAALFGQDTGLNLRIVSFTSDFGAFTAPGNSYNINLQNVRPLLTIGPGGFLNSFVADENGSFTANFTPNAVVAAVPEAGMGSGSLLALGLVGLAFASRKTRSEQS